MRLEDLVDQYLQKAGFEPLPLREADIGTISLAYEVVKGRIDHVACEVASIRDFGGERKGLEESWIVTERYVRQDREGRWMAYASVDVQDDIGGRIMGRPEQVSFPLRYALQDDRAWMPEVSASVEGLRKEAEAERAKSMREWEKQQRRAAEEQFERLRRKLGR